MKKLLLPIITLLLFTACKKEPKECLSYEEAVVQGVIEDKTSNIIVNDSLRFTLDHVLDKNDDTYGNYCVGALTLEQEAFDKAVSEFLKGYDLKKVKRFIPHFEGIDLCKGEIPNMTKDVKGYVVYYCDASNYVVMDYVNLTNNHKETYKVSNAYGSVQLYYLFETITSRNLPSAIAIKNNGFALKPNQVKFLKKEQDTILHKVHNKPMQ